MKIGENRKFSKNGDFLCGRTPKILALQTISENIFWRISKNSQNINTTLESLGGFLEPAQKLFLFELRGQKVEKIFGQKLTFRKFSENFGRKFFGQPRTKIFAEPKIPQKIRLRTLNRYCTLLTRSDTPPRLWRALRHDFFGIYKIYRGLSV